MCNFFGRRKRVIAMSQVLGVSVFRSLYEPEARASGSIFLVDFARASVLSLALRARIARWPGIQTVWDLVPEQTR